MKFNKKLFWHQGLFLQPQHLQYMDMAHQYAIQPMLNIANPCFWGLVKLEINQDALSSEVFEVESGTYEFVSKDYHEK